MCKNGANLTERMFAATDFALQKGSTREINNCFGLAVPAAPE
jgi:hypothetical protein